MKINKQTFNLNEELIVSIDQEDNDGLINIPKNINLDINIVNYFGKIVINSISINHLQDEISLSKTSINCVFIHDSISVLMLQKYSLEFSTN